MDCEHFIGSIVEAECGESKVYIGTVQNIDTKLQEISIVDASLNGKKVNVPALKIKAKDIENLAILSHAAKQKDVSAPKTVEGVKPRVKDDIKELKYQNSPDILSKKSIKRVEKRSKPSKGLNKPTPVTFQSEKLEPDFDFEGNLALFDKEAVFNKLKESITQGQAKDVVRNYKGNENVLESEPVSLRQIKVPGEHVGKEYTTDSGFIVPAISSELRRKLFAHAEKAGLTVTQRVESAGICTCQMALQLLGGERRICPRNSHQAPDVVILAGPSLEGLQSIAAARHLSNHTAKVTLFAPEVSSLLQSQLDLFSQTDGRLIKRIEDLPSQPVDLVIDALLSNGDSHSQYGSINAVIDWTNRSKAPVLALDPCMKTTKTGSLVIKWSISLGLPSASSVKGSRLYLADVGIPNGVFKDVGIAYKSPFGDKFVIPLYD